MVIFPKEALRAGWEGTAFSHRFRSHSSYSLLSLLTHFGLMHDESNKGYSCVISNVAVLGSGLGGGEDEFGIATYIFFVTSSKNIKPPHHN